MRQEMTVPETTQKHHVTLKAIPESGGVICICE